MEHTKNHEKRPAIFPVKTLQSITVTPATLTDMYVNATQAVALKVVANYLTGTVASTEEVTTQATVSASAGSYASGVYTAGATAGAATLTVTFGGQTGTITVNVNAAPAGIGSVEVTALSVIEYGTTSPVVIVKDASGVVMTTGFTLSYAVDNTVVSVNATTGVITGGAYNASAKTSNLTVTATPTTGTAKTGTAVVTVTQDTTAPTIVSVTAKSSSIVEVLFSKALKTTTGATTTANYAVTKLTGGTSTIGAAALSADGKTVTLTLTASLLVPSPNGYVLQVPNGQANKVEDLAGNDVVANSEMIFTGVGTSDTTAPTLISTAFDGANKTVTFKFDKMIDVTPATNVTLTSISFMGSATTATVALTSSETVSTTSDATDIVVTLSTATNSSILALGEGLTVSVVAGAFKDTASTPNSIAAVTGATVSATPALSSVVYNQAAKTLTYTFNKTIKVSSISDITKFGYKVNGTAKALVTAGTTTEKDALATTTDSAIIVFNIGTTSQAAIEVIGATYLSSVASGAVQDMNAVANGTISDATFTFTADTSVPTITKAEYNDFQHKLYLTFSKNMATSGFTANKISMEMYKDDNTLVTVTATAASVSGAVMTVTPEASAPYATEGKDINRSTIKLVLATGHGIKDTANVAVADIANTANKMVTYVDQTLPTLEPKTDAAVASTQLETSDDGPDALVKNATRTQVKVIFSEKVASSTVVPANFSVVLASNPTLITFAVSAVTLLSDGYTVLCTTADQTTYNGQALKVTVTGITDQAGNAIKTTNNATSVPYNVGYINATSSTTGSAPVINTNGVLFTDVNANSTLDAGDKVTLTFSLPIAKKDGLTAFTLTNVFELTNSTTPTFGTNATMSILSPDKVEIVLGTSPAITLDTTKIDVKASQTELVAIDQTAAIAGTAQVIPYPVGSATNPKLGTSPAVYYEDTNASGKKDAGDKVSITFDQNIYAASGATTADVVKTITLFGSLSSTTGYAYSISGKVLTITMGTEVPSFTINSTTTDVGGTIKLQNSWGKVAAASTAQKIMSLDTTAPYLVSAVWYDDNGNNTKDAGDYILYTFSEAVNQPNVVARGAQGPFATANGTTVDDLFYYASGASVAAIGNAGDQSGVWTSSKIFKGLINGGTFTADVTKVNANAGYTAAGGGTKLVDASDNTLAQGTDVTLTKVTGTATGGVSTAPTAANLSANATTNKVTVLAGAGANGIIKVYVNGLYRQSITLTGSDQTIAVTGDALAAGNTMSYTYTDTNNNKTESPITADGSIPVAPLVAVNLANVNGALTSASAVTALTTNTYVRLYTADDAAGTTNLTYVNRTVAANYGGGALSANATADGAWTALAAGKYLFYAIEDGNSNTNNVGPFKAGIQIAKLPTATYKKVAAAGTPTTLNEASLQGDGVTLKVGTGSGTNTYDVTSNSTILSLMGALTNNDTFTVDASGLVSAVSATNGGSNVTYAAAEVASTLAFTGTGQSHTIAGVLTGKTVTLSAATAYTVSATGITALNANGAITTLTISATVTTINVDAVVTTLALNAASTKVVATSNAGATNVDVADNTGNALETPINTVKADLTHLTTAGKTFTVKSTSSASAITSLAVTLAAVGADLGATNVPAAATAMDGVNTTTKIKSSAAAAATTQYTLTSATKLCALKIADGVTVTINE